MKNYFIIDFLMELQNIIDLKVLSFGEDLGEA